MKIDVEEEGAEYKKGISLHLNKIKYTPWSHSHHSIFQENGV